MHAHTRALILTVLASFALHACSSDDPVLPSLPPFSTDASLSALSISAGDLTPAFQTATKNYTAAVDFLQTDIRVTATAAQANAIIRINGLVVASGEASNPIPLMEGANTINITVLAEDRISNDIYTIEITRDTANSFAQLAYVKASNTDSGDEFGRSVALYADTLAVSSYLEDSASTGVNADQSDNSAADAGAVYVFTRDPAGTWSQQAYIKASNTDMGDNFGLTVALYENTLAVGARLEDSAGTGIDADQSDNSGVSSGAVYVFTRDQAGTWTQQAYIKASNTDIADQFGFSLALHEDTLAVGADLEDSASTGVNADESDNSAAASGAVYVFTRDQAGTWSQQAYIKASNTGIGDRFGRPVALHGDTLAVGARLEDSASTGINGDQSDDSAADAGAVYLFTRDLAGSWNQQAYIKASNTDTSDQFGLAVALNEETLAVGAWLEDSAGTGMNADQSDNSAASAGAVYVFDRDLAGTWNQQAFVKASNTDAADQFGFSVALHQDNLVVAASGERSITTGINGDQLDNSAASAGAAYFFVRDGSGNWNQVVYAKASNTEANDRFSWVTIFGDTLAVGANGEDSSTTGVNGVQSDNSSAGSGAVYVFN